MPSGLKAGGSQQFAAQSRTLFLALPFDLSLVFITLGEPQAHRFTAEAVPFHKTDFSRRPKQPANIPRKTSEMWGTRVRW